MADLYTNLGQGLRGIGGYLSPEFNAGSRLGAGLRNRLKRSDLDIPAPTGQDRKVPANPTQPMLDATADAEADVVDNLLPDLPIVRREPGNIPALTPAPSLSDLRSSLPILPNRRDMAVAPGSISKSPAVEAPSPRFEMDMDRRNVPIPQLPGHAGGPRPYDPIEAAKYERVMSHAKRDAEGNLLSKAEGGGFERMGVKDVLKNALRGGALGYQQTGDIAGAIGGALSAGAGSAINPQAGYEFGFDVGERPRLETEFQREEARRQKAAAEASAQLEAEVKRAGIDLTHARAEAARRPRERRADLKIGVNKQTGQREFFDAAEPAQLATHEPDPLKPVAPIRPSQAELSVDPETGMSVEEQADRSYQARGGDNYVKSHLPARTRQILDAGTVTVNGKERGATQAEMDSATREWERGIERQKNADKSYTAGVIRRKRLGSPRSSAPSGSQPTGQRKAVVGADFVNHVVNTLKVSPEKARQMIEADGYTIK